MESYSQLKGRQIGNRNGNLQSNGIYTMLDNHFKVRDSMLESTITDKGQTTVPKEVRHALGIKPRQRLQWDLAEDGSVIVRPEPSALPLFGSLKSRRKFPGAREEKAAMRKAVAARAAGEAED
jgi:AbrB family looped-hinge helix DNA binding protein